MDVRSVAGQVLLVQVVIVLLLVGGAFAALLIQARGDADSEARARSVAVAEAFANAPGTRAALNAPDPTAVLQPRAEAVWKGSDVDSVVVISPDGTRLTHPDPDLIGKQVRSDQQAAVERALRGETVTGNFQRSTLGPSVATIVPVRDANGTVAGAVSVGIRIGDINQTVDRQLPILIGTTGAGLVLATGAAVLVGRRLRRQTHGLGPVEMTRMYEHHSAVLHSVREGVLIIDSDGTLLLVNDEARRLLGLGADAEHSHIDEIGLDREVVDLLTSGRTVTDEIHPVGRRLLAVNQRSTHMHGGPRGTVVTLRDSTELQTLTGKVEAAQERLQLLYDAGLRIGSTLDVVRTAQELADAAIPRFADLVTVELLDPVLRGEDPVPFEGAEVVMRRAALSGAGDNPPFYPVGELIRFVPITPQAQGLESGHTAFEADLTTAYEWQRQDPVRAASLLGYGIHSLMSVPLQARGVVLGMVDFWRAESPGAFGEGDISLAEELASRAAVSIDNARRYTREHTTAETLQRSLLPRSLPDQSAVDVSYRYLPARAGVGGDWFDVLPLPGARVALVVGDVVGHGLHATATMGRLRTAVQNFSALDLPPDEILGHLDDLVLGIDQESPGEERAAIAGATCLYAIYDPSAGRCTAARAGHPPPLVAGPDGSAEPLEVPAGPPLGVGGLPFETVEVTLAEGSRLVMYTDGLIEDRGRDIDEGIGLLRAAVDRSPPAPEDVCRIVLDAMLPRHPVDDVALLVARTHVLDPGQIAEWEVPADPAAVARVRSDVAERLLSWGLEEEAFITELILSELITNAIRYGSEPIRVRLLHDRSLICEVSDGSSTSPHLRRAALTDEGGRGLFLVAQFAERWGTRYTVGGKVIWSEQPLTQGEPVDNLVLQL
nr:SpoIIE family protein phosphatase [Streptomyces meridianus]